MDDGCERAGRLAGLSRRTLLGASVASVVAGTGQTAQGRSPTQAAIMDGGGPPSLIVAGPKRSEAAAWARLLLAPLASALASGPGAASGHLSLRFWGGQDGVTGLNQFQARVLPGDQGALIYPGSALMAGLIGDPRVTIDGAQMLPLLARVAPGLLMLRGPLRARRGPVRVAVAQLDEPSLAGVLGLDLLQVAAEPVAAPGMEAALQRDVDAVFLHGADVPARGRALSAAGLSPVFSVGSQEAPWHDPSFAGVPTLPELLGNMAGASLAPTMSRVWRAVAAASVVDAALALPALTPASVVSRWRGACAAAASALAAEEASKGLRLLTADQAALAAASAQIDPAGQIALRRWAATRLRAPG